MLELPLVTPFKARNFTDSQQLFAGKKDKVAKGK